jgi:hypothetical protein
VVLTQEEQENLFSNFDFKLCTEIDLYENSLRVKVSNLFGYPYSEIRTSTLAAGMSDVIDTLVLQPYCKIETIKRSKTFIINYSHKGLFWAQFEVEI